MVNGKIILDPQQVVDWASATLARLGKIADTFWIRFSLAERQMDASRPHATFYATVPVTIEDERQTLTFCDFEYFELLESEAQERGYEIGPKRGRFIFDKSAPRLTGSISAELEIYLPDQFCQAHSAQPKLSAEPDSVDDSDQEDTCFICYRSFELCTCAQTGRR